MLDAAAAPAAALSAEAAAAVAAMEAGAGPGTSAPVDDGGEGAAAPGAAPANEARLAAAAGAAGLVVGALAGIVGRQFPETAYTPEEKAAAVAVLTPLFAKWELSAPWFEKYREEIAASVVLGGLGYVGYSRVRQARAAPPKPAEAPAAAQMV